MLSREKVPEGPSVFHASAHTVLQLPTQRVSVQTALQFPSLVESGFASWLVCHRKNRVPLGNNHQFAWQS